MPITSLTNPFAALGLDFYGFLLPWIFTFAIVYGLLAKAKIFEDKVNDKVSIALSFVLAFFVTAVGGPTLASFFIGLFGGASIFLAGILVVTLFLVMVGKQDWLQKSGAVLFALIVIGIVLFLASSGGFVGFSISGDLSAAIFWLLIIVVIAYFITNKKEEEKPPPKT